MREILLQSMEAPQTPDATGHLFATAGNLITLGDTLGNRPASSLLKHASFLVHVGDDITTVHASEARRPLWYTHSQAPGIDQGDIVIYTTAGPSSEGITQNEPVSEGPMRWRRLTIEHPTDDGHTWIETVQMQAGPKGSPEVTGYTWGFWAPPDRQTTPDAKLVVAQAQGLAPPDAVPIDVDLRHHRSPERSMRIHVPMARRSQLAAFGLRVASAATGELLAKDLNQNRMSGDWPYESGQRPSDSLAA